MRWSTDVKISASHFSCPYFSYCRRFLVRSTNKEPVASPIVRPQAVIRKARTTFTSLPHITRSATKKITAPPLLLGIRSVFLISSRRYGLFRFAVDSIVRSILPAVPSEHKRARLYLSARRRHGRYWNELYTTRFSSASTGPQALPSETSGLLRPAGTG